MQMQAQQLLGERVPLLDADAPDYLRHIKCIGAIRTEALNTVRTHTHVPGSDDMVDRS